jgi:hypothetical protein
MERVTNATSLEFLRSAVSSDTSYCDAMDPIVVTATRRMKEAQILARRAFYVDEHKHHLERDRQLIRRYNANKIFPGPKKSYNRQKKLYKKGMLSKHELRQNPEYEGFAFKKWMRPEGF